MKHIFFIMVLATVVISCSKEKEKTPTKMELLTTSPWFHMRSTIEVGGLNIEGAFSSYDWCAKDDPYIFSADGKLEINQGVLRCAGDPNYTLLREWQFKDNETTLSLNILHWTDWQIIKLTKDSLVIKTVDAGQVLTDFYSH